MSIEVHRMAIATVSSATHLTAVHQALTSAGTARALCCFGRPAVLDAASKSISAGQAANKHELLGLVTDVETLTGLKGLGDVVSSSTGYITVLKGPGSRINDHRTKGACLLSANQRAALLGNLHKRDIVVLVEAANHQSWVSNTRILLCHSSSAVLGIIRSVGI